MELELTRIPFVLLDIGDSMIKDVVNHQIALLNLVSSDVNYALKSNFPFYVEQKDQRAGGQHLKYAVGEDGTATTGGQAGADTDIKVGTTQGRTYDMKGMNPPCVHQSIGRALKGVDGPASQAGGRHPQADPSGGGGHGEPGHGGIEVDGQPGP